MVRLIFIRILLACLIGLTSCGPDSQLGERAARERLRKAFLTVHEAGDREGLLNLYFTQGVLESDLDLIRIAIENEIGLPIASIDFEDLAPGETIDYEFQGKRYEPTLAPKLKMWVRYATEDRLTISYLLGFQDGDYFLITARPVSE